MAPATADAGPMAVDCCVLHSWQSEAEVFDHLTPGWREYVGAHVSHAWREHLFADAPAPSGPIGSPMTTRPVAAFPVEESSPRSPSGPPISDPLELLSRELDRGGIARALLCHGAAALLPTLATTRASVAFVSAVNDWTAERWLSRDDRLRGTILVPTQVPELAAAEIRRLAPDSRFVAVLLAGNGLGKPFGHPVYEPILQAAASAGLPIVIRAGGDSMVEAPAYPVAGGMPGTEGEYRTLAPQALMTHAASILAQAVPARYPSLRFLLLGGGTGWITPFLWRLDTEYRAFRHDVLWMKKQPSVYFRECFRVGTGPFVTPAGLPVDSFARMVTIDHELANVICYASGYPDRESVPPGAVRESLPDGWDAPVLSGNAAAFFGWQDDLSGESAERGPYAREAGR
jgi:predicted TIM-barrel fold metal-dependent hydrolase